MMSLDLPLFASDLWMILLRSYMLIHVGVVVDTDVKGVYESYEEQ